MQKIYKYVLEPKFVNTVTLPIEATFLTAKNIANDVALYFIVDPEEPVAENRTFFVVPTGKALPDKELAYLGTCVMEGDGLQPIIVVHLFEAI